jgi:hypothetical protein
MGDFAKNYTLCRSLDDPFYVMFESQYTVEVEMGWQCDE